MRADHKLLQLGENGAENVPDEGIFGLETPQTGKVYMDGKGKDPQYPGRH